MALDIIGQKPLLQTIDSLIEDNKLPRFMILIGPKGCGKKVIVNYIARKSKLNHVHFENGVDDVRGSIETAYTVEFDSIYSFYDCDNMNVNACNSLLKVTEEPPKKARFIMTATMDSKVLPTLISRGQVFYILPYSKNELNQYCEELGVSFKYRDYISSVCSTPGQLNSFRDYDCKEFISTITKLCYSVKNQKVEELFKLIYKINTKRGKSQSNEKDKTVKWDPELVLLAIRYQFYNQMVESSGEDYKILYDAFRLCSDYLNRLLQTTSVNIQMLFDSFLIELKICLNGKARK